MGYTEEQIYQIVGRQDKIAHLTFKGESESFKIYGSSITIVFIYTQYEREDLDNRVKDPLHKTSGKVKAKSFGSGLRDETVLRLEQEGVNTTDIASILYFPHNEKNTFHSAETRTITNIEIPLHIQKKGRDYDWMYGLFRRIVNEGTGLSPWERAFYLACRLYYEPEAITSEEKEEIFLVGTTFKSDVEWEFLRIKYKRDEASEDEIKRLGQMMRQQDKDDMGLLDKYLMEAGNSLSKLAKEDIDQATELLLRVSKYQERKFNVTGKIAIYLNVDRYLHVYMRHVKDLKIKQFEGKSNFQWEEEDVLMVIRKVIEKINDEIQDYFKKNSGKRYSRFGRKSVYFEGDYYTLHIEANGSISTFHKNWKLHEQNSQL